ncbi:unnamed protein product [Diabrotica balteata]|uniref:Endonuclease-reverse transcriptase n=1 Tax=Diabrotica balteata TaxID=107213 RepID=A0A9N9SNZ6_DIABA|nr:unnamed protein product [Diabrotica balteata]
MLVTKDPIANEERETVFGSHTFGHVDNFTYLGSLLTATNKTSEEIKRRINLTNRTYYGLQKHFHSRNIQRRTKIIIYKTLLRPVLTYGAETWTLTQKDERLLGIFKRKILCKIFEAINVQGQWRRRYKFELYQLFDEPDGITFIKTQRLRLAGHIIRMPENTTAKKLTTGTPVGRRSKGRPRIRLLDGVDSDLRILKIRKWQHVARNRTEWRRILEQAKIHRGLSSQR